MKKSRYISTLLLLLGLSTTQAAASTLKLLTGVGALITSTSFGQPFNYQSAYGSNDDLFYALAIYEGATSADDRVCGAGYTKSYGFGQDGLLASYDEDGDSKFFKAYGRLGAEDLFNDIIVVPDNHRMMAGSTKTGTTTKQDFYFVETDDDGVLTWAAEAGGTKNEMIEGLATTSSGFTAVGWTKNGYSAQKKDMVIISLNRTASSDPVIDWSCRIGGINNDDGKSIAVDATTGDITAIGTTGSFCQIQGIMVATLDASGNKEWGAGICPEDNSLSGEINHLEGYGVTVDDDGNKYVVGFAWRNTGTDGIEGYPLVVQLTSSGALGWKRLFGQFNVIDEKLFAADYKNGWLLISGYSRYGATQTGAITAVLNATTGEMEWFSILDGSENEHSTSAKFNRNDNVMIGGWTIISSNKATFMTELFGNNGTSACGTVTDFGGFGNDSWVVVNDITTEMPVTSITVSLSDITNDVETTTITGFTETTTCP